VGGAAAALLGLLFVAISIRLEAIASSVELRNRAAQTLVLFGSALVAAILLSLPHQPLPVLGAELITVGALTGLGMFALDRRAGHEPRRISRTLNAAAPNATTAVLYAAAGLVLALDRPAGLYVLVAPVLAAFLGGVTSAWLFMIRVRD
jgi:hypothetical protein